MKNLEKFKPFNRMLYISQQMKKETQSKSGGIYIPKAQQKEDYYQLESGIVLSQNKINQDEDLIGKIAYYHKTKALIVSESSTEKLVLVHYQDILGII